MDIGKRMKELRIQYGLTQQELADRSELTKGFISQLERNQNSPSIGTLLDIIQCLGTTPAEFFTDEEPEQIVFEKDDYFEKISEDGNKMIEWIIPNAQKKQHGAGAPYFKTRWFLRHASATCRRRIRLCIKRNRACFLRWKNLYCPGRRIFLFPGGEKTSAGK